MSGSLLLLLLLVPLLALAAVALFAFAGCALIAGLDDHVPAPTSPATAAYADEILKTPGLIAYWRLGDASAPTAIDETHKFNGTYHGGVVLRDTLGALEKKDPLDRAPTFNGQDAYVEVPALPGLSPPLSFSVEAWVRPSAGASGPTQQVVAFRSIAGAINSGFELTVIREPDPNPRIQGRVGTGGITPEEAAEVVLAASQIGGEWRYLVVTYEGTAPAGPVLKLYVNGVLAAQRTKTDDPNLAYGPNSTQPLRIGAGRTVAAAGPAEFFAGAIDEVALYGIALDAGQVKAHFDLSGR